MQVGVFVAKYTGCQQFVLNVLPVSALDFIGNLPSEHVATASSTQPAFDFKLLNAVNAA